MSKTLATISVTLTDVSNPDRARTIARMMGERDVSASLLEDQCQNVGRLAEQVIGETFRAARECPPPAERILTPVITDADRNKIIADWLRAKAPELKGLTLYHPEHSLSAWANELSPLVTENTIVGYSQSREGSSNG